MIYYSEIFETIHKSLAESLPDLSDKQINVIAENLIEDLEGSVIDVYYDIDDPAELSEDDPEEL